MLSQALAKATASSPRQALSIPSTVTNPIDVTDLQFTPSNLLSKSASSSVYLGKWKNQDVTIKFPQTDSPLILRGFLYEFNMREQLLSSAIFNVVQLYGGSIKSPHYFMVTQRLSLGSLREFLKSHPHINWATKYQIIKDITTGLEGVHTLKIVHRNINSSTIFINQKMRAFLSDFELAQYEKDIDKNPLQQTKVAGTTGWIAPESYKNKTYSEKSDVYSLGTVFWEIASCHLPFETLSEELVEKRVTEDDATEITPQDCPPKLAKLIRWCWKTNPEARPTEKQILEYLDAEAYKIDNGELEYKSANLLSVASGGRVYLGKWHTQPVAIKFPYHDFQSRADLTAEFALMEKLSRAAISNVVQFYGGSIRGPLCYTVTKYMSKGSLRDVLKSRTPLSWSTRYRIMRDITTGLTGIHQLHIVHRDIKSLNVLLDENMRAFICDFGSARYCEQEIYKSPHPDAIGTTGWIAPECYKEKVYSNKSDIYSLGTVFWEIVSRQKPFDYLSESNVEKMVAEQNVTETIPANCPPKLSKLIRWCWQKNANDRPTEKQILDCIDTDLMGNMEGPKK
jgi:serine/threonine protein kinase